MPPSNSIRCMYSQCMPCVYLNGLWTGRRHVCITASRRGKCFWDSRPYATSVTKCEKDGKAYWKSSRKWVRFRAPHWLQGYGHFSRRPLFALLAAALLYSSILPRTSRVSAYILALCLRFHFCVSLLALSSSLSQFFIFDVVTMRLLAPWR